MEFEHGITFNSIGSICCEYVQYSTRNKTPDVKKTVDMTALFDGSHQTLGLFTFNGEVGAYLRHGSISNRQRSSISGVINQFAWWKWWKVRI